MISKKNNLIKVIINDNQISISNKTSEQFENCFIVVENIFFTCLCKEKFNLSPNETIKLSMIDWHFRKNWENKSFYVKVYKDDELIFKKTFNDKTKCFVLLSNKKYEELTEQLIIGLSNYSTVDIKHYTINYKSELNYDYLENIELNIDNDENDPQFMQFVKPAVFCNILEKGYENAIFLDSDIQVKSNIDKLFNYFSEIEEGPIFQKSYWDYTLINGKYVPQEGLSKFLNLPEQQAWGHGVTNVVLFNKKHYDLFVEWKNICFSDEINQIRKEEFLHDELILNCLLWKHKIVPKFFYFAVNVRDDIEVDFFYNYKFNDYEYEINLNNFSLGHYAQSFFFYDKSEVFGFHCVKDPIIASKINNIIHLNESNSLK